MAYIPYNAQKLSVWNQKKGKKYVIWLNYAVWEGTERQIYRTQLGTRKTQTDADKAVSLYATQYNLSPIKDTQS